MVMSEIRIAPSEHPVIRRWFEGDHLDLIIWETPFGDILRFRLLSRLLGKEIEGIYWDKTEGLHCAQTPSQGFLAAWRAEGPSLPPLIFSFIEPLLNRGCGVKMVAPCL